MWQAVDVSQHPPSPKPYTPISAILVRSSLQRVCVCHHVAWRHSTTITLCTHLESCTCNTPGEHRSQMKLCGIEPHSLRTSATSTNEDGILRLQQMKMAYFGPFHHAQPGVYRAYPFGHILHSVQCSERAFQPAHNKFQHYNELSPTFVIGL